MMRASRLQLVKVKKPLLHVRLHKGLLALLVLFCVSILLGLGADLFVRASSKSQIVTSAEEIGETDADCILVLGCLVRRDGSPSDMLADRLDAGIELYKSGKAPKLLMSGDHGRIEYDEVNAMKGYAVASKQYSLQEVQGLSLMSMIPYTIEPMISQAIVDKTVISEIYLRLTCASTYHNSGNDAQAIRHLDRAIALVLPDKLYGILAECRRPLDSLLDARLVAIAGEEVCARVEALYKHYSTG